MMLWALQRGDLYRGRALTRGVSSSNRIGRPGLKSFQTPAVAVLLPTMLIAGSVPTNAEGAAATARSQQPQQIEKVRQGRLIADLVQAFPGRTIEVQTNRDEPLLMGPPAGLTATEWLAEVSDAVVRARVIGKVGRITEGGDWVVSDVTARVLERIKSPDDRFGEGSHMLFAESGGVVDVGATRVVGVVPYAHSLQVGNEYLLFVKIMEDGTLGVAPSGSWERLGDSRFRNLVRGPSQRSTTGSVPEVLTRVRAAAARGGRRAAGL